MSALKLDWLRLPVWPPVTTLLSDSTIRQVHMWTIRFQLRRKKWLQSWQPLWGCRRIYFVWNRQGSRPFRSAWRWECWRSQHQPPRASVPDGGHGARATRGNSSQGLHSPGHRWQWRRPSPDPRCKVSSRTWWQVGKFLIRTVKNRIHKAFFEVT